MGRLERLFEARRAEGKRALVAYLAVGDPSLEESVELARACLAAGADVLELGVPYSDPAADGPAIARASQRAIRAGGGLTATLKVARAIREASPTAPIVLFGYYNPIYARGEARTLADAADAGVDALLIVDLPLGEGRELRDHARERGLAIVPLIAPTSAPSRADELVVANRTHPAGFVYYVSVTGVTGSAAAPLAEASRSAGRLREASGLPVVVGFGIDSPEKATVAAAEADGVVVGTALVKRIEEGQTPEARLRETTSLIRALREALDAMPPLGAPRPLR